MTTTEDEGRPTMVRTPSPRAAGRQPRDAAPSAPRLEALLGDPDDPANPYGRAALASARRAQSPDAHDDVLARAVPRSEGPGTDADRLVRVLRPLLRRDLALGHAWAARLLTATPARPDEGARALLGPAALIAATGGALYSTARLVDARAPHEPAVRQWQPALAAVFADLLACECLTATALRATHPDDGADTLPVAVVGHLVPQLVADLLDDLELVLHETGFGPDTTERRALAALHAQRPAAGVDRDAAAAHRTRLAELVRTLAEPAEPADSGEPTEPAERTGRAAVAAGGQDPLLPDLFRLDRPAARLTAPAGGARWGRALLSVLPDTARLADAEARDPAVTALARTARRLAVEQRAVLRACATAQPDDPAHPAARALADRCATVLLAGAALGVARAAARSREPFLGGPDWILLALERLAHRLGTPLPGPQAAPHTGVWTELAERTRRGVDCDARATKLLW
ncbi:hypothetical protein ACIRF8_33485 [Streptomyces sp. NPDC102406]|uniref:hypothetical protein n=1 Tax=Streptomyces sp. NPDC102406 TaxID=3366171 RepID=UPI00381EF549